MGSSSPVFCSEYASMFSSSTFAFTFIVRKLNTSQLELIERPDIYHTTIIENRKPLEDLRDDEIQGLYYYLFGKLLREGCKRCCKKSLEYLKRPCKELKFKKERITNILLLNDT